MLQGKLQSGIEKLNSIFSVPGHNRISNPGIFQVFTASLFSTLAGEK